MRSYFYSFVLALVYVLHSDAFALSDANADLEGHEIMESIEQMEKSSRKLQAIMPKTSQPKRSYIAETRNSRTESWKVVQPPEKLETTNGNTLIHNTIEAQEKAAQSQYELESSMSQEYLEQQLRLAEEEEQYNLRLYAQERTKRLRSAN